MKRLTIRNADGSVSQPTDLNWAEALKKLAAYEDTGLMPEQISKWISVDDRLPASFQIVLVATSLKYVRISYHVETNKNFWMVDQTFGTVTHWMPLPEPPKEPQNA